MIVTSDGCDIRSSWGENENCGRGEDFKIKKEINTLFSSFRKKEVNVKDLLSKEGLVCSSFKSLRVVTQKNLKNFVLSLTPFFSQDTIIVYGKYRKGQFMDDVSHSMEGL